MPVTIKNGSVDLEEETIILMMYLFYTGMGGYKMCFKLNAKGTGTGTHVSVSTYCSVKNLAFPMQGSTVTIQLVNHGGQGTPHYYSSKNTLFLMTGE